MVQKVDEEDFITVFRDEHYGDLVMAYFRTRLHKTLDFYNCFVDSPDGDVTNSHFTKVMVTRSFQQTMDREVRPPTEESWGDIGAGLVEGSLSMPAAKIYTAGCYISSWFRGESNPPQADRAAPQATPQATHGSHPNNHEINTVTDALRNLFEWLTAQSTTPEANATAATANSYCRFKETTTDLIGLLKSLSRAYETAQNNDDTLDLSNIWTHLVRADAARHHGQELTINLNQTGLLNDVVMRHSATKSTAYAIGGVGGVGVAIWGARALTGWFAPAVIVAGGVSAVVGVSGWYIHNEYRNRARRVKTDFDSFRRAWDTVARTLALQFAASMGIDLTTQNMNEDLRDNFLRRFGLDSHDFSEEEYIMAGLRMHVKHLDQTFQTLTENLEWIDRYEDLGLRRGVEAA
ncbi:hypothetical protein NM208_g5522 [Fusarium decemcellulare]|uniref:Uncharacterized protein n=1 Tax=Fusarium decemcellulare TaxID=57161 RepID=A0ACC1SGN3_9HYPO|nr:hypothetical protein NM208_g5522 [Fusarium decemcellulare]